MGYYVQLTNSTVKIPAKHLNQCFEALKKLNTRDDLKFGGNGHGRWFSWMPADYDKTTSSALEILDLVGYECRYDEDLNLVIEYYDNKAGCEDVFIQALAPFIPEGQLLEWRGEDGAMYRFTFRDKKMYLSEGEIVFSESGEYVPLSNMMLEKTL
jgi:hypothetical protein